MKDEFKKIPFRIIISTYITFIILILFGHARDAGVYLINTIKTIIKKISQVFYGSIKVVKIDKRENIVGAIESFYVRRIYSRIKHCWNRPIEGVPGPKMRLIISKEYYGDFKNCLIENNQKFLRDYNVKKKDSFLKLRLKSKFFKIEKETEKSWENIEKFIKPSEFQKKYMDDILNEFKDTSNVMDFIKNENLKLKNSLIDEKKEDKVVFQRITRNLKIDFNELISNSKIEIKKVLNVSSYNYLGFGTKSKKKIRKSLKSLKKNPIIIPAPIVDTGTFPEIIELGNKISKLLKTEKTLIFPMGFGVNSGVLPTILIENVLIFSDELVHTSIIFGVKMSKCSVVTFLHNDMKDLEQKLILYLSQGNMTTHRSWDKIFVLVEGVYSMEGTILKLSKLLILKKKYKFYIFLDEAHSIGVLGRNGGGVADLYTHKNIDFINEIFPGKLEVKKSIDIYMGTFTKSFGASGGYISGSKDMIHFLETFCDVQLYGEQIPPVICSHIIFALDKIIQKNNVERENLRKNIKYLRNKLIENGFVLYGSFHSPIIPILIFNPGKLAEFSKLCLKNGIAVVVVGYPATPILSSRVRVCVSSGHSMKEIKYVAKVIIKIGKKLGIDILNSY